MALQGKVTDVPWADLYGRQSTDFNQVSSEARQGEGGTNFIAQNGWRQNTLPYERESGRHGDNADAGTVLGDYLRDAMAGKKRGRIFVAERQDRIGRGKFAQALFILTGLVNHGVTVAFWATGDILSSDSGVREFLRPMMEAEAAERDNEVRIGRVNDNISRRRGMDDDVYTARTPDWMTIPRKVRKGELRKCTEIKLKPGAYDLITEIFEWTAAGDGSLIVAARLNRLMDGTANDPQGRSPAFYRPWRGERWTDNVVNNLVKNAAVRGHYIPHTTTRDRTKPKTPKGKYPLVRTPLAVKENYYPKIIGDDLWHRAQTERGKNKTVKVGRPPRSGVNLFQGLCKCDDCGSPMYLTGRNKRALQDRLVCSRHRNGLCDNRGHYSVQRLERGFLEHGLMLLARDADFAAPRSDLDAMAARLEAAVADAATAKTGLDNVRATMRFASNDASRAVVMAQVRDEMDLLRTAEQRRDQAAFDLDEARVSDPDRLFQEAEELATKCDLGHIDERRRMAGIIRTVVSRVRLGQGTAIIETPRNPLVSIGLDLTSDAVNVVVLREDWERRKLTLAA